MFGKRTTAEFLQVLPEHLDEDTKPFYDLLVSEIKFKDIEDVLQDLKEARLFGKKEIGKLAFSYVLDPDVRHVQNDFLPLAKKLEGQIESAIKSHYKWKPDHNQKLEVYRQIFLYLISGTRSVTVFTTNYDTAIEEYCRNGSLHTCVDGFADEHGRSTWTGDFTKNVNYPVCLYKLHGSLGWKRDEKHGIVKSSKQDDEPDSECVIIAPTRSPKDEEKKSPFSKLFGFMEKEFGEHNACIAVGCSFRDESVNDVFREFIRNGKAMVAISPTVDEDLRNNLFKQECRILDGDDGELYIYPKEGQGRVIAFVDKFEHDNAIELIAKSRSAIKKSLSL